MLTNEPYCKVLPMIQKVLMKFKLINSADTWNANHTWKGSLYQILFNDNFM